MNQKNNPDAQTTAAPARRAGESDASQGPGRLRILSVVSECAPYAKIGGLGDAVAGLAKALRQLGHDARIMLPLYASIDRARYGIQPVGSACVHLGNREEQWIGLQAALLDDEVPVWFVDCERFFGRSGIYDGPGGGYSDNAFRFGLLSKAALQVAKDQRFIPDIMHGHDWPTALVPALLKTWDRIHSPLSETASVLTIHNVGYQGVYPTAAFPYIGVGWEHFTADKFEDHGQINLLKAGIHFADAITTVSPSYAREILTPMGGCGLAPHLNARAADLFGILNGADYEHWDPSTDALIPRRFSPADLAGKAVCKAVLQEKLRLEVRADWPVLGIVSRFAAQKGFSLMREALPRVLGEMNCQLAVLGNGDPHTEDFFRWLESSFAGRVGCHIGFSSELSHLIQAGSDFFLMPSRYEPCGLSQMYAMKYGALPIVRATGGLDDTVQNYDQSTGAGTGFKFGDPTGAALQGTLAWAIATWFDRPHHIAQLRRQAMAQVFSWKDAARRYEDVYQHARHRRRAIAG